MSVSGFGVRKGSEGLQTCLILSTNKHRFACSLIYGDRYSSTESTLLGYKLFSVVARVTTGVAPNFSEAPSSQWLSLKLHTSPKLILRKCAELCRGGGANKKMVDIVQHEWDTMVDTE